MKHKSVIKIISILLSFVFIFPIIVYKLIELYNVEETPAMIWQEFSLLSSIVFLVIILIFILNKINNSGNRKK